MTKAKGWDARDARFQAHRIDVVEETHPLNENVLQYRWECLCRRNGQWTSRGEAARRGGQHERRHLPKASERKGPKVLRELVKLNW